MDGTATEIQLDQFGVCNFCRNAQRELELVKNQQGELEGLIQQIRASGGKYDCLIGLSGGVDSSMVLHKAVQWGLRPLCFSIDNGWNTPQSDENIMRMVEKLKVPFFKYTINNDNFKKLQAAFIMAGLKNLEIPTDHILMAATYEVAAKYGIRFVLSGGNVATESIMPASWGYNARDLVHIKDVYKKMMGGKLPKGFPTCSLLKFNWYKWIKGIEVVYPLDYIEYNRELAIHELTKTYGYKEYGQKHCESYFTWWFQNYYLFTKYGIDKRKAHWSSMIVSGQLDRKLAMESLTASPEYPDIGLNHIVHKYPRREHSEFKTDERLFNAISKVIRTLRKWKL